MNTTEKIFLFLILFSSTILRLYGLNWDQGYHLHPDERAIILSVVALKYPHSLIEFFSPSSPWNTHFFAYGALPFYLLRITGDIAGAINPFYAQYDGINLVGRVLSVLFDLGTIFILFLIGRRIVSSPVGLLSAFLYAISVLPIQLSHFYAVDTPLTFFVLLTLFFLIRFYENPQIKYALLIGVSFGAALATKISALVLIIAIGCALTIDFLLLFLKHPHKPYIWSAHLSATNKHLIKHMVIILPVTFTTFIFLNPYALIDFPSFWQQTIEQSHMTKSAFTFPYTLQYVGKIPYLYELKNIFFFGQGPLLAMLSFIGIGTACFTVIKKGKTDVYISSEQSESRNSSSRQARTINSNSWAKEAILLVFFFAYFLVVGHFAIGFMRYMLPIYPLLCLFAAIFLYKLYGSIRSLPYPLRSSLFALSFSLLLIWPISFMHIYSTPHPRVAASVYLNSLTPGETLAVEHWDDSLPLWGQQNFRILTLPLYDPDTDSKWQSINVQLEQTDYIILASNRLYTPLMRLTDCQKLPLGRCYPTTAKYYEDLFAEKRGFTKVADFTSYPTIPIFNIPLNDQGADESFTVYDHPRVLIFKKGKTK